MNHHPRPLTGEALDGFRWFSDRVAEYLSLPADQALVALGKLIAEAAADKEAGFGPPQDDINKARRKWLDLYAQHYGRAA